MVCKINELINMFDIEMSYSQKARILDKINTKRAMYIYKGCNQVNIAKKENSLKWYLTIKT